MAIGLHVARAKIRSQSDLLRDRAKRADSINEFAEWCAQQRTRVAATLKQQTDRVDRARFGDPDGTGAHVVVSKRGWITTASGPIDRPYQDQFEGIRELK